MKQSLGYDINFIINYNYDYKMVEHRIISMIFLIISNHYCMEIFQKLIKLIMFLKPPVSQRRNSEQSAPSRYTVTVQYSIVQNQQTTYPLEQPRQSTNSSLFGNIKEKAYQHLGTDKIAYLLWLSGVICWQTGWIYYNQHNINCFQSSIARGICLIIINTAFIIYKKVPFFPTPFVKYLNIRHFLLAIYGFCYAQSQFYLPLPVAHMISCSGPLFIFILDYFINNVHVSKKQIIGAITASLGVLFTINGPVIYQFIFGQNGQQKTQFQNYKSSNPLVKLIASAILTLGTIGWSIAQIFAKKIHKAYHYQINFHLGVTIMIVSGCFYVYKPEMNDNDPLTVSPFDKQKLIIFLWSLLFGGIPLVLTNLLQINALLLTQKTGNVTMVGFFALTYSYGISIFRYGEKVNIFCLLGAMFIALGIYRIISK